MNLRTASPQEHPRGRAYHVDVLLISFAALLLEISYTRIFSFKLYYYYTYLVIGLALLGLGAGGVAVILSDRLKALATDVLVQWSMLLGAVSVGVGYVVIAWMPIRSMAIWDYGTSGSYTNLAKLLILCLALFASFVAVGVVLATLFGRRPDDIGRLYFADLVGAGLACAIVVPLIGSVGPPTLVLLAGALLTVLGLRIRFAGRPSWIVPGAGVVALVALALIGPEVVPDVRIDDDKAELGDVTESRWNPVFRVDAAPFFDTRQILYHDGLAGSVILEWDGDTASLDEFAFDADPRSLPFDTVDRAPERALIIGAAGGHEVLASLAYGVTEIDAIELNPATHELVTGEFADFGGRFFEQPGVNYVADDGRSFLARGDNTYDLIWFPAPDSYAASNVAASGAFVLSESYLYTEEAVGEALDHLSDDGIIAAQFGELNFDQRANRTIRYATTVRAALEDAGVDDPAAHVLVASTADANFPTLRYSTVLVKATPFTDQERFRFASLPTNKPGTRLEHVPGSDIDTTVNTVLTLTSAELDDWYADFAYDVTPIDDNGPFFWHFSRFGDVLREISEPVHPSFVDPEDAIGERVMLLLLVVATVLAGAFLVLPFALKRDLWASLPQKAASSWYFGALGLGFMFFEITTIQRLVLFLGYPTYSLTVTLASILIFTGVGALVSARLVGDVRDVSRRLIMGLAVLTVLYLTVVPRITDGLLSAPLAVRVAVAVVILAPLGTLLGLFMPLGIRAVARLSTHSREYVAWGWAINGFASVVGSVLTTMLAMIFGFNAVLVAGLGMYVVAVIALRSLTGASVPAAPTDVDEPTPIMPVDAVT